MAEALLSFLLTGGVVALPIVETDDTLLEKIHFGGVGL